MKRGEISFDRQKFKELVLYMAEKSEIDPNFGATKLNKLLFYADFLSYQNTGRPITGCRYQKLQFGPAPRALLPVIKELEQEGRCVSTVRQRMSRRQRRLVATEPADLGLFTADEIALVDEVLEYFWSHNAVDLSDGSHTFIGWKLAEIGEDIPYETALVGNPRPLTEAEIDYGRSLVGGTENCHQKPPL